MFFLFITYTYLLLRRLYSLCLAQLSLIKKKKRLGIFAWDGGPPGVQVDEILAPTLTDEEFEARKLAHPGLFLETPYAPIVDVTFDE